MAPPRKKRFGRDPHDAEPRILDRRTLLFGLGATLAALSSPTAAGELRFGNTVPGMGLVHKRVVSMRERKFTDLVRQETDFSCGAAVVATILTHAYGQRSTEEQILVEMLKVSDREKVLTLGFSLLDIKDFVQTIGFRGEGFSIEPANLLELRIPVIALIDLDGYRHFVIVRKVSEGRVYVGDPALGNYILPLDEFLDIWQNNIVFAIIGDNYNEDTVLSTPSDPLSAR